MTKRAQIWDLPTRLFHWVLLAAVVVSVVSVEVLDDIDLHLQSGQVVLGLLVFRLLWLLIGPASANLASLVRNMFRLIPYLRGESVSYAGHSPLGAFSVVALLASLSVQVITGLGSDDEIFTTGPLVDYLTGSQVALANVIHEWNKFVLLALVCLHIGAVVYYQFVARRNLVGPMVTGCVPRARHIEGQPMPVQGRSPYASWIVAAFAAFVAWWVFTL